MNLQCMTRATVQDGWNMVGTRHKRSEYIQEIRDHVYPKGVGKSLGTAYHEPVLVEYSKREGVRGSDGEEMG